MSASIRFNPTKTTPGPVDYNNDTLKVKSKQPAFSMSSKYRHDK
jgi:hypothetical protein